MIVCNLDSESTDCCNVQRGVCNLSVSVCWGNFHDHIADNLISVYRDHRNRQFSFNGVPIFYRDRCYVSLVLYAFYTWTRTIYIFCSSETRQQRFSFHRLRGSASTVLTATGQVNGRWRILTPTESKPMSRLQQISAQLITSGRGSPKPNLVQMHPLGASGQMGEYNSLCFFIYNC